MNRWKRTREDAIDLVIGFLFGAPLCAALLQRWPQQPEQTLGYYLRDWAFCGVMLFCFGIVRGFRLWRQPQSQRRAALSAGALRIVASLIYFAVIAAGGSLLWVADSFVLKQWDFWVRFWVVVPLGFPLIFGFALLGLWAGSVVNGKISSADKPRVTTRSLRVPDAFSLAQLAQPLLLRTDEKALAWFSVPCFALSAGAWTGYGSYLADAQLDEAIIAASFALWIGLGGLFCLAQSRALGQISATQLRPRLRRAFSWQKVASVEESCSCHLLGVEEMRLLHFQNAQGKSLWNLPLSEVNQDDLRELEQLIPDLQLGATDVN